MLPRFQQWLALLEHFDPLAYNRLFDDQLKKLLPTLSDSGERSRMGRMLGLHWTGYIAAALRNAGFREQGQLAELIHDIVVKLLVSPGGLFSHYDERRHGPLDLRFKASVGNAVRNVMEKERNRKKYLRPVSIATDFVPGGVRAEELPARPESDHDATLIERFRKMLQAQHGDLALAVFDARLDGQQTKDLVGLPELGSPSKFQVKHAVQQVKAAACAFAQAEGDPAFQRQVERLLAAEAATVGQRKATTRQRQALAGR